MENNKVKGFKGEVLATKYLREHKYLIVESNYTSKIGEIDIVAFKDDTIVFVEVKCRASNKFGMPREAVNYYKQRKIRQVATSYLLKHRMYEKCNVRFDVIDIVGDNVTHIPNAF